MPATAPGRASTRCSPRSSLTRLRTTSRTSCKARTARSASSASRAWRPTSRSSRACCAIRRWGRTASIPTFVERHVSELTAERRRHPRSCMCSHRPTGEPGREDPLAGARMGTSDPLAVLTSRQAGTAATGRPRRGARRSSSTAPCSAPRCRARSSASTCSGGDLCAGAKGPGHGSHEDGARDRGTCRRARAGHPVTRGDTVFEGAPLLALRERDVEHDDEEVRRASISMPSVPTWPRCGAQRRTLDAARPDAVARRRDTQQRTVRENIEELCDRGSFVEYGSLVIAAQRAAAHASRS